MEHVFYELIIKGGSPDDWRQCLGFEHAVDVAQRKEVVRVRRIVRTAGQPDEVKDVTEVVRMAVNNRQQ